MLKEIVERKSMRNVCVEEIGRIEEKKWLKIIRVRHLVVRMNQKAQTSLKASCQVML